MVFKCVPFPPSHQESRWEESNSIIHSPACLLSKLKQKLYYFTSAPLSFCISSPLLYTLYFWKPKGELDDKHVWRPEDDAQHSKPVFTQIIVIFLTAKNKVKLDLSMQSLLGAEQNCYISSSCISQAVASDNRNEETQQKQQTREDICPHMKTALVCSDSLKLKNKLTKLTKNNLCWDNHDLDEWESSQTFVACSFLSSSIMSTAWSF